MQQCPVGSFLPSWHKLKGVLPPNLSHFKMVFEVSRRWCMFGRSKTETIEFRKQCKFWAGEADIWIQNKQCDEVQAESYCLLYFYLHRWRRAEKLSRLFTATSSKAVAECWSGHTGKGEWGGRTVKIAEWPSSADFSEILGRGECRFLTAEVVSKWGLSWICFWHQSPGNALLWKVGKMCHTRDVHLYW